jgi:hypothetical protein
MPVLGFSTELGKRRIELVEIVLVAHYSLLLPSSRPRPDAQGAARFQEKDFLSNASVAARPHTREGFTTCLTTPLTILPDLLKRTEYAKSEFCLRLLASSFICECVVLPEVIREKVR